MHRQSFRHAVVSATRAHDQGLHALAGALGAIHSPGQSLLADSGACANRCACAKHCPVLGLLAEGCARAADAVLSRGLCQYKGCSPAEDCASPRLICR